MESQTVGLTAGLEQQPDQPTCESQHSMSCVQPVSSDFNDRGGERERQSISFRSCVGDSECNDPDSARIVGYCADEAHDDQTEVGQGHSKVE